MARHKFIIILLILFLAGNLTMGQSITIHGFMSDNNPGHLVLATIDAQSGQTIETDTIQEINAYAPGSSAFDDVNQYFMFTGVDTSTILRFVSWDLKTDSVIYDPYLQENINDIQFDMKSGKFFGLGSYIIDSTEVIPGQYSYEYATRFLELGQQNGQITEYNRIPELRAIPAGGSTFDANGGRYIVNGFDEYSVEKIYVFNSDDGSLLSSNPISLGNNEYLNELEYNNNDNKLYGLYRDLNNQETRIVSIDLVTNDIDPVVEITDLQYFVQGASVFHQLTETYILYYVDTSNTSRLMLVDVNNQDITGTPFVPGYFTELKADNNEFAIFNYHNFSSSNVSKAEQIIKIFPNPVSEYLNIRNDGENGKAQLFNTSGQIVFSRKIAKGEKFTFPVSSLRPGPYILWYISGDTTLYHKVIVK